MDYTDFDGSVFIRVDPRKSVAEKSCRALLGLAGEGTRRYVLLAVPQALLHLDR
jgi:hypothetical protein